VKTLSSTQFPVAAYRELRVDFAVYEFPLCLFFAAFDVPVARFIERQDLMGN
jgi:hypothetical protein